jgi:hypothetical protein
MNRAGHNRLPESACRSIDWIEPDLNFVRLTAEDEPHNLTLPIINDFSDSSLTFLLRMARQRTAGCNLDRPHKTELGDSPN